MLVGGAVVVLSFVAAFAGSLWALRNASRLGLVQAPNARSSHVKPTPTGGGIGIVLGMIVAGAYAAVQLGWTAGLVLVAAMLLAAVGLRDDVKSVHWTIRLGTQFVLFGIVAFTLLPPLLAIPAVIGGVLFINIFNFMDGIDGIAGMEAAFVFLGAAIIIAADTSAVWWLSALAAACLGFLVLNFPPARIFMGDVGSTALGLTIASLAIFPLGLSLWQWLILPAVFLSDGLVTLGRRIMQGERVFEAHRRHAYQLLSRKYGSHRVVTLGALAINVIWLLPLAWSARDPVLAPWLTILAYAPLVVGAYLVGAGKWQPGEV